MYRRVHHQVKYTMSQLQRNGRQSPTPTPKPTPRGPHPRPASSSSLLFPFPPVSYHYHLGSGCRCILRAGMKLAHEMAGSTLAVVGCKSNQTTSPRYIHSPSSFHGHSSGQPIRSLCLGTPVSPPIMIHDGSPSSSVRDGMIRWDDWGYLGPRIQHCPGGIRWSGSVEVQEAREAIM